VGLLLATDFQEAEFLQTYSNSSKIPFMPQDLPHQTHFPLNFPPHPQQLLLIFL
jgi:hypothetical protein